MFRISVIALSVALFFVPFGILVVRNWPTREQRAQMAAQRTKQAVAPQAANNGLQEQLLRGQLINRVTQPYNRMIYLCEYVAQYSYLAPAENIPSKCARLRAATSEAITRMRT